MAPASFESSHKLSWRHTAVLVAASLMGVSGFLVASMLPGHLGFPLDDSWIHETYARNLALSGQWEFRPGMASAGSTSPLWTILLVPGYWLSIAPLWWSYILGFLALLGLSLTAEVAMRHLRVAYRPQIPWAGLLVGTEWHLVWAAVSGMETLLYAALITVLFFMLIRKNRRYTAMGMLTGLCVWVRPDALTIAPLALVLIGTGPETMGGRARAALAYLLGLGALLLPYLALNLVLSNTPLPNTFYAKQAEYAGWQGRSIAYRIGAGLLQLSSGSSVLLWPGLGILAARAFRERRWAILAVLSWCLCYVLMYALRLPPYQHGRYLMPVLPVLLVLGFAGLLQFTDLLWPAGHHHRIVWAWKASLILIQISFVALGAKAYAQDVALIETEMVKTARWVQGHLQPDAVIAAHDIGALGYFDDHRLIDLAGLVSPEVIPFIRDEDRLAAFLDEKHADYLMTFPDWYPDLVKHAVEVYRSQGIFSPLQGGENMRVYRWNR